jgi:protein-S-isoprenylcysteine O-methyltransferase Ste14
MIRYATLAFGVLAYAAFLAVFLYAVGFIGNVLVPKSIDSGATVGLAESLAVNVLLLGLFAVQHSWMARPSFKRMWTRIVPKPAERSTYVLIASATLALMFWQWRPMPQVAWEFTGASAISAIWALFWLGWLMVLASTFLINHFNLFGLDQVWARFQNREPKPAQFVTPLLYKYVRHPIYLGFIIAFWATPVMSIGHLLFAVATTGYILVGVFFEERDLIAYFGDRYRQYRHDVGMLLPKLRPGKARAKRA